MTYRVYIRDYSKAEVRQSNFPRSLSPKIPLILISAAVSAYFLLPVGNSEQPIIEPEYSAEFSQDHIVVDQTQFDTSANISPEQNLTVHTDEDTGAIESFVIELPTNSGQVDVDITDPAEQLAVVEHAEPLDTEIAIEPEQAPVIDVAQVASKMQTANLASKEDLLGILAGQQLKMQQADDHPNEKLVTVKAGDSMALIFQRLGLGATELHEIMALGNDTRALKSLRPGQTIRFTLENNKLQQLQFDYGINKSLSVSKVSGKFKAETLESEIEKNIRYANAEIDSSLFLAGQRSGIDDQTIMNLVSIYGWDIDFAQDIRQGDKFALIFEEHFVNGKKIGNGPILAAEFINQNHRFRAVRYTHENGDVNYYSDTGHNMRKAFMRTPLNYARISSHFNLRRKHPVLNKIRAHKGVDYAARTGTPIKATGDGVVVHRGTKGGYGRTIILRHGGKYTTLYAHMSKYASKINVGSRVKQGQIIGYVGSSGLATGPHLHYEFRINGVHRNPLKVKLPKALKIPESIMADFTAQTRPLLAQLDKYINQSSAVAANQATDEDKATYIAMRDDSESAESATQ